MCCKCNKAVTLFALSGMIKSPQLLRLLIVGDREEGGGGFVPKLDVNFNKYPFCLSLKVLDKYYCIPIEKGAMTESVVFFCKCTVLNM